MLNYEHNQIYFLIPIHLENGHFPLLSHSHNSTSTLFMPWHSRDWQLGSTVSLPTRKFFALATNFAKFEVVKKQEQRPYPVHVKICCVAIRFETILETAKFLWIFTYGAWLVCSPVLLGKS